MGKTIVTHSGGFHADDVFAVAALLRLFPDATVIRSRDQEIINQGDIVVDVGSEYDSDRLRFDHHQTGGAGERVNGIPYAAVGLVWKHFGEEICGSKEVAEYVDTTFIQQIDAIDVAVTISEPTRPDVVPYVLEDIIDFFLPTWKEGGQDKDKIFLELVAMCSKILDRVIQHAGAQIEGRKFVEEAYAQAEDKRIIILDNYYPWKEVLVQKPEPLFLIYPRDDNKWGVRAVPESIGSLNDRKKFPVSWGGKRGSELANVSGVSDAVFCHVTRYLAGAESKEGALRLAQFAIEA